MDNNSKLDIGRGCEFDGAEAKVCDGCFKLHETDWLEGYPVSVPGDVFEVRFKNTRRGYYKNVNDLPLRRGDIVAVEASPGHDVGIISLTGDMVARQMKRTGFSPQNGEFKAIYRKAKPYDIEKWQEAIAQEHETMIRSRQIAKEMGLDMKIGDVEYQGDRIKAIFYYIADGRVDFRELIKVFASEFGIKVEMKQIGARQEAARIGGLGSCGRELCCTSWIANFNSVTTGAARTQDISLNPQKLAGQCCKLKCCLAYELDAYIDARKSLPRVNDPLQALDGDYFLVSTDVLRRTMSFNTQKGAMDGSIVLPVAKVREIQDMNRRGQKPDTITGLAPRHAVEEEPSFVNMVGEESITRFDKARSGGGGRSGRGGRDRGRGAGRGEGRERAEGREGRGSESREERSQERERGEGRDRGERRGPQNGDRKTPQNEENKSGENRGGRDRGRRPGGGGGSGSSGQGGGQGSGGRGGQRSSGGNRGGQGGGGRGGQNQGQGGGQGSGNQGGNPRSGGNKGNQGGNGQG